MFMHDIDNMGLKNLLKSCEIKDNEIYKNKIYGEIHSLINPQVHVLKLYSKTPFQS